MIDNINAPSNGLSFQILRAKCLYASLVHERIQYGIDTKTIKKWKPAMGMMVIGCGGYKNVIGYDKVLCFSTERKKIKLDPLNLIRNTNEYIKLFDVSTQNQRNDLLKIDEQSLKNSIKYCFEEFAYNCGC